jgi:hypothetical protein
MEVVLLGELETDVLKPCDGVLYFVVVSGVVTLVVPDVDFVLCVVVEPVVLGELDNSVTVVPLVLDTEGVLRDVELLMERVVVEDGVLAVPVLVVTLTVLDTDGDDAVDTRLV